MSINTKALLKDKNVLRVVVLIAVVNLLGYVMLKDFNAVIFFVIVGFLATYYSKNMIIVALIAMVATNIMVVAKRRRRYEGFASEDDTDRIAKAAFDAFAEGKTESEIRVALKTLAVDGVTETEIDAAVSEAMLSGSTIATIAAKIKSLQDPVVNAFTGKPSVLATPSVPAEPTADVTEKFDNQYPPYENKSTDSLPSNVSDDADKLVRRQKELLDQFEKLQPALERSYKLLDSMGGANGIQGMIERVGGMIDKFGGLSGKINKT